MKLGHQFRAGHGGGQRLYDTVGAGSKHFRQDGRKDTGGWEIGAPGLREPGWQDVRGLLGAKEAQPKPAVPAFSEDEDPAESFGKREEEVNDGRAEESKTHRSSPRPIFQNLTVYINGSTAPRVSDHKLKRLLAEHGAGISIALGRRSVTHVILGTPNGSIGGVGAGAGGGLAAGKIQKEILRVRGCGIKYVSVDWVLDSIAVGKRLPEARFQNLNIAHKRQKSVYGMFRKENSSNSSNADGEYKT